MTGEVEIDETYVGGLERNRHKSKKKRLGSGGVGKSPMVGLLQRDGKVVLRVIEKDTAKGDTIKPIVREVVSKDATIYTDGFGAYYGLDKEFAGHGIVDHTGGEYVRGKVHTNSIEGFWSIMKRGIYGIYHSVSHKHLHRYCNEFSYRYNNREQTGIERFEGALHKISGTRLTYKGLIGK